MPDKLITVKLLAQTGQYQTQMAAAAKQTQGFSNQVGRSAKNAQSGIAGFAKAAATFGKVVTIGVAGGLALSAKAAIDFESSFTGVKKTLDATPAQFARLRTEIRGLAKDIPISVNELNRIGELGGQLGVSVNVITSVTETIAKLGVTTNLSSETAAVSIARLANILSIGEDEFENFGSSLVDLGNNFATTEDQILTFALRIAPVGATIGLTGDDVLGLATAFSSVGVPAERGGTAVQRAFISMAEAVETGGDNLEVFGKVAGVTGAEFAEIFEVDAARAVNMFLAGLGDLNEAGGNVFETLDSVGLGSQRTVQAMLAMANASGLMTDALNKSESAWEDNLALTEEADLRFETTASKITLAKNQLVDFGITLGDNLLPALGATVEMLGDFVEGIANLSSTEKNALAVFFGITAALTATNVIGKKLVTTFGVQLPGALASSTLAAGALNVALGAGLLVALGAIFVGFSRLGRESREAAAKVRDLTDAIEAQAAAGGGGTSVRDTIIGQLSARDIELLDNAGISYNVFADAVMGSGTAFEIVQQQAAKLKDELSLAVRGFDGATRTLDVLYDSTIEYNAALDKQAEILAQENLQRDLDAVAKGYDSWAELQKEVASTGRSANDMLGEQVDLLADAEAEAQAYVDALAEIDDQLDSSFGFVDAVQNLAEAMAEVEAETEPTFDQLLNVTRAMNDVERAARDLGPNGIKPMLENLERSRQMGLITEAQYRQLMETLLLIQPVANAFGDGSAIITANLGTLQSVAAASGAPISGLINLLIGLNAAMAGTIQNAEQMTLALDFAINKQAKLAVLNKLPGEDAASQLGGVPIATVNEIKRRFDALAGGFTEIGGDIAEAIGAGISGGGGGGGGGGGDTIEDVVEDEIQKAIDAANAALDSLVNAMEATLSQREAMSDLARATQDIVDLQNEQATLPDKIRAAEKRLEDARKAARATTLEELLEIQIAEETLARARLAHAQGRISDTELALAEQAVTDARADAVADTKDVEDAEDDLADLRERELEIAQELTQAELDLLDAQLDLVAAQRDLIEAGASFNDIGRDGIQIFKDLATEVGLSAESIQGFIDLAEAAGLSGNNAPGTSNTLIPALTGGGDDSGGNQYTVKSGDTLSKIAKNLGVSLTHLLNLNQDVMNSNTNKSRRLDPNVIFPGDILQYALGGRVPGLIGSTPRLAMVEPGEEVMHRSEASRFRHSFAAQAPVTIANLHVNGVFDPTRPGEWSKIMRVVRDDLEYDRRSRTV